MSLVEINDWISSRIPPNVDVLTLGLVINLAFVGLAAFFAMARARRAVTLLGETMAPDQAAAALAAPGWFGRMDRSFEKMIDRNGYSLTTAESLGIMSLAAVTAALLILIFDAPYWAAALAYLFGFAAPLAVFAILHRRWKRQVEEELPDFLFLLQKSIRSGLTFPQALEDYSETSRSNLAHELRRAVERHRLGMPMVDALGGVARRLDMPLFDVFVSVVALQQETGGDLPYLLEQIAKSVRGQNQFRGYVRTATSLGRISAFAMVLAYPAIFVMHALLETGYVVNFFESTAGWILFGVSLLLEIAGIIWLWRLLKVEE